MVPRRPDRHRQHARHGLHALLRHRLGPRPGQDARGGGHRRQGVRARRAVDGSRPGKGLRSARPHVGAPLIPPASWRPARVALLPCCVPDVPRASCPRRIPYCISAVSCRTASHPCRAALRCASATLCPSPRLRRAVAMLLRTRAASRPTPHCVLAALSRRGFLRFRLRFSHPIL